MLVFANYFARQDHIMSKDKATLETLKALAVSLQLRQARRFLIIV